MILPPDFIDEISTSALNAFLDHLILTTVGADSYSGSLDKDRETLLHDLKTGNVLIEQFDEFGESSFGLISKEKAMARGYLSD